ncbi:Tetratricopeptide repeat protein [Polystyrenella longa]|uniref:Tetratricopeptide repeat protein n=1 Tax=Polystyrenella longa TaxID=2528007 RepID=A0A518CS28_9PLAN|nr:tetratricopeptide repeat protein [Polystyrenella longa]QDU82029.1 Tetratricopeptide repeat protein [Polystyrenella longa]
MTDLNKKYDEAVALKNEEKLDQAVVMLEEIVAEAPDHKLSHSALAVYLQKLNRMEEAVAHAKRVVEIDPSDTFSYTQLSIICQRCGLIQEAEDALAQARIQAPQ